MAIPALHTARTGLDTAQEWMNQISHSAANIKSIAFKDSFMEVTDLAYTQLKSAGTRASTETFEKPIAVQRGSGSKVVGTSRIMTQGSLKQTGNPLDIAIRGVGYFAVNLPNGVTGYTRAGALKVNRDGRLVTSEGYELADDISIDTTAFNIGDINIAENGAVTVKNMSEDPITDEPLGNIALWLFPNEQGLQDIGGGILIETEASGDPLEVTPGENNAGSIEHKSLEMSNVSTVEVMTNLLEASNVHQLNTKILMAVNEMEKETNNMYQQR